MPKAAPVVGSAHARTARSAAEPYTLHAHKMSNSSTEGLTAPRETYHERPSTAWSAEDDKALMQFRQQGLNWGPIAEHFAGKTPNACRKRHERLMERKNTSEWDTIKTEDLAAAYFECREMMWRILADHLGETKWQTLENKCMEKGFKNLQTAARGARRGSQRFGSPASHPSDGFDDSGLGHDLTCSRQQTPAQHALPPLQQGQYQQRPNDSPPSRASPAARSTHSQSYGQTAQGYGTPFTSAQYPPVAPTLDARPPVLSSATTSYTYPSYNTTASAYNTSYPTAASSWSMANNGTLSTTSAGHRLPSLSENLSFLPPPMQMGGVMGGVAGGRAHIATSTYG